jgi:prepilin-type N-terminal cleavage/methylation domain-containing protein
MRNPSRRAPRRGFTLVEILVVLSIILLVATIAIPATWKALNGRQVTDAARIFTGALVGAKDSAIKFNEPRGIRLLPDPQLTIPAPGLPNAGSIQLVYNKMLPIEPAGDLNDGKVNVGPVPISTTTFPTPYPNILGGVYPYPSQYTLTAGTVQVLMVEEAAYVGGYLVPAALTTPQPNAPTNWWWNVRVGDKIKIGGTGRAYTIVGPCTVNPWTNAGQNPEMFVNAGPPGSVSPISRMTYFVNGNPALPQPYNPEFLFLVNGDDDDLDGYVDEGWDGQNQNPPQPSGARPATAPPYPPGPYDPYADDVSEWEIETWVGAVKPVLADPSQTLTNSPSFAWAAASSQHNVMDNSYIIQRRPVPTSGAREIPLPGGTVIDATTWNSTNERSRIPVQFGSLYCDIMITTEGRYIPTTVYSAPTSASQVPFLHFWLTDRTDVYPDGVLWGSDASGVPNQNPSGPGFYRLPMGTDALAPDGAHPGFTVAGPGNYPPAANPTFPVLKGDRRLVTLFAQSGLVIVNTLDAVPNQWNPLTPTAPALTPSEGLNIGDVNSPFYKAQLGQREAR